VWPGRGGNCPFCRAEKYSIEIMAKSSGEGESSGEAK